MCECETKEEEEDGDNGIYSMEDILQSPFLVLGVHWGAQGFVLVWGS